MDDRQLDELLSDARRTYHAPPALPLDAMWSTIERDAFAVAPAPMRRRPWYAAGLAAALLIGVIGGRLSVRTAGLPAETSVVAAHTAAGDDPYHQAAEELLGRTAVLLTAVRGGSSDSDAHLSEQASQLLGTTRLLLDSPVGSDTRLRGLLQDLELVLAQVARLEPARTKTAMPIITAAVDQRDLVPRIRTAVVELSLGDN